LRQIHKNADLSARASEAAAKQGKFWEMHDMLFDNQEKWAEDNNARNIFEGYASSLELDMEKFKIDIESQDAKDKVQSDFESGRASSVTGTPTFFLNGKKIENPRSSEEFRRLIIDALEEK
jgi:protein-disulfide isomerase